MRGATLRTLTIAVFLPMLLGGCLESNRPAPEPQVSRDLPPIPEFAKPVYVPPAKAGERWEDAYNRERAGRLAANGRIIGLRKWSEDVRQDYAQ